MVVSTAEFGGKVDNSRQKKMDRCYQERIRDKSLVGTFLAVQNFLMVIVCLLLDDGLRLPLSSRPHGPAAHLS